METSDVVTDIPDLVFDTVKSETIWNEDSEDKSLFPSKREGLCSYRFKVMQKLG